MTERNQRPSWPWIFDWFTRPGKGVLGMPKEKMLQPGLYASLPTAAVDFLGALARTSSGTYACQSDGAGGYVWVLIAAAAAGTGDVTGPGVSVDSEIALFSGITGKIIKRASTTGLLKAAAGVIAAAVQGTDYYAPGGTDVAIADGGTGQSTATAAFNALDPLTTKGDLLANDGANSVRLAVGTDTYVLTADAAQTTGVKWSASSGPAGPTGPTGPAGADGGLLYAQVSVAGGDTIANTVAITKFATFTAIPAGSMVGGKVYRLRAAGVWRNNATTPSFQIDVLLGPITIATASVANQTAVSAVRGWELECLITVDSVTAGGVATLEAQGYAILSTAAKTIDYYDLANASTAGTVDTTITQDVRIQVTWGTANANNTITQREYTVEVLGAVGPAGAQGAQGVAGVTGPAGAAGASTLWTAADVDLGPIPRTSGQFEIEYAADTAEIGVPVIIHQIPGAIPDELEMDRFAASGLVSNAWVITAFWQSPAAMMGMARVAWQTMPDADIL